MKPHPAFADREIAKEHRLGPIVLRWLTVADVDRDYAAVMESADDIHRTYPDAGWPEGLTFDENAIDLAWHQREFTSRRSFAWVIEDRDGGYLGCAYVYPSMLGDAAAEVVWWWRTGGVADRDAFREDFLGWLAGADWPDLDYRVVPRHD